MSKKEKLLQKFLTNPIKTDLTFSELETLLTSLGYRKIEGEGSRVKFHNPQTTDLISLHKPHPENVLKVYVVREIQRKLREIGHE
jgi:predicted RNA binding protein YcfA (HicA-like mRNA interferase family)